MGVPFIWFQWYFVQVGGGVDIDFKYTKKPLKFSQNRTLLLPDID